MFYYSRILYLRVERRLQLAQRPKGVVRLLDLFLQVSLLHRQLLLVHVGVVERLLHVVQPLAGVGNVAAQALVRLLNQGLS